MSWSISARFWTFPRFQILYFLLRQKYYQKHNSWAAVVTFSCIFKTSCLIPSFLTFLLDPCLFSYFTCISNISVDSGVCYGIFILYFASFFFHHTQNLVRHSSFLLSLFFKFKKQAFVFGRIQNRGQVFSIFQRDYSYDSLFSFYFMSSRISAFWGSFSLNSHSPFY